MNKTVTITPKNHKYANTYGGNICASDFCTDYEGSRNIAERIASDWRFDRACARNRVILDDYKGDKNNGR